MPRRGIGSQKKWFNGDVAFDDTHGCGDGEGEEEVKLELDCALSVETIN